MFDRRAWLTLLVSLLVAVGAYWIWFFRWDIYTWGDWGFTFTVTAREFLELPQAWVSSDLGAIDISLSWYPILRLTVGLLSYALPAFKVFHLVYLLPSVLVTSLGSFLLVRYVHKSNLAGLVGSFVFSFNTYFLIIRGGHLPLVNAFALAPLALLTFLHGLKTSRVWFFLLSGLLLSLSAAYETRGALLLAGLLFGLAVFFSPTISRRTLLKSTFTLITFLIINLYWLLGLFLAGGAAGQDLFHRNLYGQGYAHIVRSSVLQLYQWSPNGLIGPGIQPTPAYLWLLPLLAFTELYLGRKSRLTVYFGLVSLAGIFFSKMSGQPFPAVYEWMFRHFPGFSVFREPSKFFFLSSLGYAVLLSGLALRVWTKWHRTPLEKVLRLAFVSLVSGLFLINARGVITGDLGELLKPRAIPPDYLLLNDFILSQPEFFRTLYLPSISRWGIWTAAKPTVSGLSLVQGPWNSLNGYTATGLDYSYIAEISHFFTKDFSDHVLDMASVKYVVVPVQDRENNDDFYAIYGPRDVYLKLASGLPYLNRLDIGTARLAVFENLKFRPRFYLTDQPDSAHIASTSAIPVSYIRRSATQYQVTLSGITRPVYLNFSDLYHPGWKITPGSVSWLAKVSGRQAFLSDSGHLKNDAGLNSFLINPGQSNLTYTVYFQPQAYLNLGLIFSIAGAVTIISYLLITTSKFLHG